MSFKELPYRVTIPNRDPDFGDLTPEFVNLFNSLVRYAENNPGRSLSFRKVAKQMRGRGESLSSAYARLCVEVEVLKRRGLIELRLPDAAPDSPPIVHGF